MFNLFKKDKSERIYISLPVYCFNSNEILKTQNVSPKGAFILSENPLQEGEKVDLIFYLPNKKNVKVSGVVKHVNNQGFGVAFDEIVNDFTVLKKEKKLPFNLEKTVTNLKNILLLIFLIMFFLSYMIQESKKIEFNNTVSSLEEKTGQKIITMVHRKISVGFLGIPIVQHIEVKDAEKVLAEIRKVPSDKPIGLVLHTPGGLLFPAFQIARALKEHKGPVTVYVPHYAMSGGTLIALAADKIVMDPNAILGPVDPQLSTKTGSVPAVSVLNLPSYKALDDLSDQTLIIYDQAKKSLRQVKEMVYFLLSCSSPKDLKCRKVVTALVEGKVTHDYPITYEEAKKIGLPVKTGVPEEVYKLINL